MLFSLCCMVLVLRVAFFYFLFWQTYGIYRIQTSKKKKKKKKTGKGIGGANIRHSWFSMAWHPKTEPPENTSAPDLHETATTITVVPKEKMITIFVHTKCVHVHVSNFMDATIITYLQVNTPHDTCRTCKTAFSIFYLLKWLLRDKHRQKKKKSIAVQKDKK